MQTLHPSEKELMKNIPPSTAQQDEAPSSVLAYCDILIQSGEDALKDTMAKRGIHVKHIDAFFQHVDCMALHSPTLVRTIAEFQDTLEMTLHEQMYLLQAMIKIQRVFERDGEEKLLGHRQMAFNKIAERMQSTAAKIAQLYAEQLNEDNASEPNTEELSIDSLLQQQEEYQCALVLIGYLLSSKRFQGL